MSNFEIKDRRGERKLDPVPVAKLVDHLEAQLTSGDKSTWLEVKAAIAPAQIQQPPPQPPTLIMVGRVLGLRSDDLPFIADYWLSPDYDDCRDWEKQARKRLDTFLGCDCASHAPCGIHKMYIPQWQQADMQRLTLAGTKPLPRVLEVLHKAQMARVQQSSISLVR